MFEKKSDRTMYGLGRDQVVVVKDQEEMVLLCGGRLRSGHCRGGARYFVEQRGQCLFGSRRVWGLSQP